MFYLSVDCDFENPNLCGYTQDKTDNFDWTRAFNGTRSYGTGPSVDHTYGTKAGVLTFSFCHALPQKSEDYQNIQYMFSCYIVRNIQNVFQLPEYISKK